MIQGGENVQAGIASPVPGGIQTHLGVLPAEAARIHVMIAVPSFGMVSMEFLDSIRRIVAPMNTTSLFYWPRDEKDASRRWMPVDEARNQCVRKALEIGAQYIFFRDDDVLDGRPDSLLQMMQRDVDIVSGVYCVKTCKTDPLIFKAGTWGGFRDWTYGDFLECQAVGMGLTLIKTEIFKKIPEPWFVTQRQKQKDDPVGKLADSFTEDIYFCEKARQHGFKIWVDTGIQAMHQDVKRGLYFCFNTNNHKFGWFTEDGKFWWVPDGKEVAQTQRKAEEKDAVSPPVKFNLGAGMKVQGYVTVDINGNCDETMDVRRLEPLVEKYGRAEEIFSEHLMEHLPFPEIPKVMRNWCKALRPGGRLKIGVPDLEWCVKHWLSLAEEDYEKYAMGIARIFGLQSGPGQEHKGGFTKRYLESLAAQMPLKDVSVRTEHDPEKVNQPTLWLEGIKTGAEDFTEDFKMVMLEPRKNDSDGNGKGTREQVEGAVDLAQGAKT